MCIITKNFTLNSNKAGLIDIVSTFGLEGLLLKILDTENDENIVNDLHDILNSMICSINQFNIKNWLTLCKNVALGTFGN